MTFVLGFVAGLVAAGIFAAGFGARLWFFRDDRDDDYPLGI